MNEYQPFSSLRPFAYVCLSEKASQQSHLLKMKRTAMEAHIPDAPRRLFLYITMPQDHWGQQMTFTLQCNSNDTVDDAKRSLQSMIWDARGWCPKLSAFQFQQDEKHIPYTRPVTDLNPLLTVICARTA